MSKSLAELRASAHTSLPERAYALCLAQGLVAEAQSLQLERDYLAVPAGDDGEQQGSPKRNGEGPNPRLAEIDARLEELWAEMREHTGELRLRAIPAGEWRRWVDTHPAREDNKVDESAAYGFCDADALLADLAKYVQSWNGDPLAEGDWEFIANRAAAGDLKELCRVVVQMHEVQGAQAPKGSRTPSSATSPNGTASSSPEPSGSAPSDSSAGSLTSDTSTSTPTAT